MIASVELEEVAEVTLLPVVEVPPVLVPAEELPVTCPSMALRPSYHGLLPPLPLPLTHCPQRQSLHLSNRVHDLTPPLSNKDYSTSSPCYNKQNLITPPSNPSVPLSPIFLLSATAARTPPAHQSTPLPRPHPSKSPRASPQTSP